MEKKFDWKKYLIIFIIASGTTVMYSLPYLKSTFYDPMRAALGLDHQQLGNLISMYGILATILYFPGGFLADKLHSRLKVIGGAAALLALSWAAFLVIPVSAGALWMVMGNFFLGVVLVYAIRSQYFADIDDAGIDVAVTGRVSGILSTFGYLPDVFIFSLAGSWIDSYAGKAGYDRVFLYAAAMGVLCVVISLSLLAVIRRDRRCTR